MRALTPVQLKRSLAIAGGVLALLLLLLGLTAAVVYSTLPDIAELTDYQPKLPLQVFTTDGQLIGEFGTERRRFVPLDEIPHRMQDALLAIEDTDFYEHGAVSYSSIARVALTNLTHWRRQGASTITQQVARNFYLTRKKYYSRKFVEILLAYKIEAALSKRQILEVYMNHMYLGERAYGFEAAASVYFGKTLKELSIAEAAMLAGLPKNPAYANPVVNFDRARDRQLLVLKRMQDTAVITAEQAVAARAEKPHIRTAQDTKLHAEYAAEMARQVVVAQYGDEAYTRGLKVTTTLVATEQAAAYKALRRSLLDFERRKAYRGPEDLIELPDMQDADATEQDAAIAQALADHADQDDMRAAVVTEVKAGRVMATLQSGEDVIISGDGLRGVQAALSEKARDSLRIQRGAVIRLLRGAVTKTEPKGAWAIVQAPEAEGAFVALEPATGRVHALVGGFDFAKNQFNHVTQAPRQPGSSFKPFVYSAALEQGISPATVVNDAPITIGDWSPKNYDGQFDGPMTVRKALAKSKNMVTIRVMQLIGPARVRAWAARFGFDIDKQPDNLTLALGSGAVSPLQMASAYSVIANGGHKLAPLLITKIADAKGAVLFEAPAAVLGDDNRAIPERNAFVIASLLQEVARSGTAARAQSQLRRPDIYGKTGTTNDSFDAWFAGFQPGLAAVVWIGYDQPRSLGDRESGGGLALPVWIDFMSAALRGVPVKEIAPVAGVVQVDGEWRFEEFALDGGVREIGLDAIDDTAPASPTPASSVPN